MAEQSSDLSNEVSIDTERSPVPVSVRRIAKLRGLIEDQQIAARDRFVKDNKLTEAPPPSSFLGIAVDKVRADLASQYDKNTGLRNRATFTTEVEREIAKVERNSDLHGLQIGMLDIDKFGIFNSTYGIPTGDKALRAVAAKLDDSVRDTDLTGRWGGEEFAFALPFDHVSPKNPPENYFHMRQTTSLDKRSPGERIRESIADIPVSDDIPEKLTASIGLTDFVPGESFDDAFKRASDATLIAKLTGKNRTVTAKQNSEGEWRYHAEIPDQLAQITYKVIWSDDGKKIMRLDDVTDSDSIISHPVKYSDKDKPELET